MHEYEVSPDVFVFSTTRHGGVSKGNYASFNINHYCGDDADDIRQNQRLLCERLGIGGDRLIYPHQTHHTEVRQIDRHFLSLSESARQEALEGVDALITDERGVCIGVSTADCIPVVIYDTEHHAVAAVHAGWRGTVARITEKAVAAMTHAYGSQPADMLAVIGPGISLENFEVGDEVYEAFLHADFPMEMIAKKYPANGQIVKLSNGQMKWHLDLPSCNGLQLQGCGLKKEKIQMSGICTFNQYEDYFSARRLGINSGRIFTGALLR